MLPLHQSFFTSNGEISSSKDEHSFKDKKISIVKNT